MTRPAGRAAVNAAAYPCNLLAIDPEVSSPSGSFRHARALWQVISNEFHHRPVDDARSRFIGKRAHHLRPGLRSGRKGLSVSKPKLAFLSNTSVTTVRRVLSDLSERGYIERTHVGENEPSTWVACVGEQSPSSPSPIETPSGRNSRSRVMSIAK